MVSMYDKTLVIEILDQIIDAIEIVEWAERLILFQTDRLWRFRTN